MNHHLQRLAQSDPIAAQALGEFSDPALAGSFRAWPSEDRERLASTFANRKNRYIMGITALYIPDAAFESEQTDSLAVKAFLFESGDKSKEAFIKKYVAHVSIIQWAQNEVDSDKTVEARQEHTQDEARALNKIAAKLFKQRRRLVGGYAVLSAGLNSQDYQGFVFGTDELVELYRFGARDATLRGMLDQTEAMRAKRLVMISDDPAVASLAQLSIIKRLPPKERVAQALGYTGPLQNLDPGQTGGMNRGARRRAQRAQRKKGK